MADVVSLRTKTEQRCSAIVAFLREASGPVTYDDIRLATGGKRKKDGRVSGGIAYDVLLFVMTTLVEVNLVTREKLETRVPGRPRVHFRWVGEASARAPSARSARAA